MSFGGNCNYACRSFERDHDTDRGYREAAGRGIVMVASAGNQVGMSATTISSIPASPRA